MARPTYIWQLPDWPAFRWDDVALLPRIAEVRHRQGLFLGLMRSVGLDARLRTELETLSQDALKTSAIEGETLDTDSVRSSVARRLGVHLGLDDAGPRDRRAEGLADILFDATRHYDAPLTEERLFGWHADLFPVAQTGKHRIDVGCWRSDRLGAMQIVSGLYGARPKLHFDAPPAPHVPTEMRRFLHWFNRTSLDLDPLLRAALAHLWFLTIHPLDDGNGRIGRAVVDLAIAQMERTGSRFYALSAQIERERKGYYDTLEATHGGSLDITAWLVWFIDCYAGAIEAAERSTARVLARAAFWQAQAGAAPFNERQQAMLGQLLDGFEGHITARKWASLGLCSADTAQRDIAGLVARGLLIRNEGGSRSTSYRFVVS